MMDEDLSTITCTVINVIDLILVHEKTIIIIVLDFFSRMHFKLMTMTMTITTLKRTVVVS